MTLRSIFTIGAISTTLLLGACQKEAVAEISFETNEQKVSYSIGQTFAKQLSDSGLALDKEALKLGMDDIFNQAEPRLTEEEISVAQQALMKEMQAQQQAKQQVTSDTNIAAGEAFLAANATKEGVITTDSGLQYTVITQGDGALPASTDTVNVHYSGTLIDGTEFDSSYKRGEPAQFPVNAVIAGWTEVLQLMPTGSKYQVFIPSSLAYGPGGTGPNGPIGPNATLIFDIELLDIVSE